MCVTTENPSTGVAAELAWKASEPLHVGRPNVGDRDAFIALASQMFDRGVLSNNGPLVLALEAQIAEHLGVRHCVAMANGTVALEIAISAVGMTGEVIVPSYTFVATAHAVAWQGLTPVFADIDPVTHTVDPESVRSLINERTGGIIGVHLWGHGADVAHLDALGREFNLPVIYDAAHAFSASVDGEKIGSFGRAEVFSFHATKFFNTFEGGAVTTNDDELASKLRLLRNFGFDGEDSVVHLGTNGKMTEICAAMGLVNLRSLEKVIARNRDNYDVYQAQLSSIPGLRVFPFQSREDANFQYVVIEIDETARRSRDEVLQALRGANVLARRYFWPGAHRMQPYRERYPDAGDVLPETLRIADRVIVLPTGTAVDKESIDLIARVIKRELVD